MSDLPETQPGQPANPPSQGDGGEACGTLQNDAVTERVESPGPITETAAQPPTHFGRYRVCRRLGGGGFGIV